MPIYAPRESETGHPRMPRERWGGRAIACCEDRIGVCLHHRGAVSTPLVSYPLKFQTRLLIFIFILIFFLRERNNINGYRHKRDSRTGRAPLCCPWLGYGLPEQFEVSFAPFHCRTRHALPSSARSSLRAMQMWRGEFHHCGNARFLVC